MIDRNEIPSDIGDYLQYNETSKTGLRWAKLLNIQCRRINVGDEAGSLNKISGYYLTTFNGKLYSNHRIIYFLYNGYSPDIIDHIDGNKQNNNINNLREATVSSNNYNSKLSKRNNTGVKGLSIIKQTHWRLKISKNGKVAFLEYYKLTDKTKEECRIILENKRKELHGPFANHG